MTSTNDKNKILGYHSITPTIKKIPVNKIKEQIIQDRFELEADDKELEHITDVPVEVLFSHESQRYIPVKGRRIVHAGIEQGIKKLTCMIIGEVDHDHEAIAARLAHIFATVVPFHILEECQAINHTMRLFKDTYKHGGKRRGTDYKKQSTIYGLCKHLPHKRSRIDILKRFGNHVGSLGIEGFYCLLKAKKRQLSLYLIHGANPILRNMKMRTKISRKIKEMRDNGSDESEIKEEIGKIIFDVFFEKPISEIVKKQEETVSEDSRDEEGDGGSTNPKKSNEKDKTTSKKYMDIGSMDYKRFKQSFNDMDQIFPNWSNLVNSKNKLKASETEKIYKLGKAFEKAFEEFWVPFLVAGVID